MSTLLGAVEAGGTTFRCATGHGGQLLDAATIPTTTPAITLDQVVEFFKAQAPVAALGVASFGPVNVDPAAASYGTLLDTPKIAWQGTDLLGTLRRALKVPAALHTDVVAAGLAEHRLGAGRGCDSLVYVTVGTGIGGAVIQHGEPAPGRFHAEMGHILVPREPGDSEFAGLCPFHGDCLEGLASAPAIAARWGRAAHELPAEHPAWKLQAGYLATLCVNLTRSIAPYRILLGGGVMRVPGLLDRIRLEFSARMAGYHSVAEHELADLLPVPQLEPEAGLVGALLLAERA